MNITDNYIIDLFKNKKGNINSNLIKHYNKKDNYIQEDIYNYLIFRYNDTCNIKEIVYRIFNHIEHVPVCKMCGKPLQFINSGYKTYCSKKCSNSDKEKINKEKKTKFAKYGNENYNGDRKLVVEKIDYKSVHQKAKQTIIDKYGVDNIINIPHVKEKIKEICKERYGVDNISQLEEIKNKKIKSCLLHHNVSYGWHTEESINKLKTTYKEHKEDIINKIIATNNKRYGKDFYTQTDEYRIKVKETYIERYGVDNYNNRDKYKETCKERYGVDNYNNKYKSKETCKERYGVDNYSKTQEFKIYISKKLSSEDVKEKRYNTMKINNSWTISKPEENIYNILKEIYPDIIRQYRSELYPFNCDFYIPCIDIYIECNFHWTHGGHPFDCNNQDDINKLEIWKSKNTKYYDNAIKTWTISDVNKRRIAKENKLKYLEFFSDEINSILCEINNF